jgi:HD-GYP domain-containing protein (c-di-GMP phosphodiesterase class II)
MIDFSEAFDKDKKRKPSSEERRENSPPIDFSSLSKEDKDKKREFLPDDKDKTHPSVDFSGLERKGEKEESLHQEEKEEASLDFPPVRKEDSSQQSFKLEELYEEVTVLVERILSSDTDITESDIEQVRSFIENLLNVTKSNNQQLLEYVFNKLPKDVDFISLNSINVCILSLEMGMALGYSHNKLIALGIGAFLHDIGMKLYRDLYNQPRKIHMHEKQRIMKHPLAGSEMLQRVKSRLEGAVFEIVEQEHERIDGSGYPRGLKGDEISEYAQIIGFVDVYEALTHQRPYRRRYSPLEAVKIMLGEKNQFIPRLTKVFLERIGLYPKGTFVELNTKEVAQVVKQNPDMPSCPIVRVVYGEDGKKSESLREVDLSQGTKIYITRSV